MTIIHGIKNRHQGFQTERRKVQRQILQSVLLCGLVLVIMYALIIIATGIFIIYTQFFDPEIISNLNAVQPQRVIQEKQMSERLSHDPVALLLQGKEIKGVDFQTFAPYEDYESSDEEKLVHQAAAAIDNLENSHIPFQFGLNGWIRQHNHDSMGSDTTRRSKRSAPSIEAPKVRSSSDASDGFPKDLFTLEQRRNGAILLHLCGLCYIFVTLVIVCDEFFGATFMAAGGSAPEFFTSVFGVFITSNNVGVGTIVGSATFNILFVLSFCTFFSRQVLHLTWYPMFRDMFFYVSALFLLLIFFVDEVVDWYEALMLFGIYIIYGVFMKYNAVIERAVKRQLKGCSASVGVDSKVLIQVDKSTSEGPFLKKHLPIISTMRTLPVLHSGAIFRTGLVNIAMDPAALTGPFDSDTIFSTDDDQSAQLQVGNNLTANEMPNSSRTTSSIWSTSTALSQSKFNDHRQSINVSTLECPSPTDRLHLNTTSIPNTQNEMNLKRISVEIESEHPIDLSWPSTFYKRCIYIILAPIMFPLCYTLPDVKKPNRRHLFLWTFVGSIIWIAVYSYLMVFMASTIGETFGIPNELMGLTVLAAGTSIPDLITSVIVARKGLGDMAVSSSIGSNLFDICVGLPLPWILYYIVGMFKSTAKRISVESNGLVCSIGMLFMMLVILYGAVAVFGWRMSKKFGVTMIVSYGLFCMLSILLEIDYLTCPLKRQPSNI